MNKNPKVSILVPIYGVEKFIERCAISLFEQSYQNIEYIFVNDCTKDKSIVILKEVLKRYPNRKAQVRIIEHEKNRGLAAARNTAVAAATGEFLMHVDSDDYVDKKNVTKSVCRQLETNADVVVIDFIKSNPKFCKVTKYASFDNAKEYCLAVLSRKNSNSIWAKLIRRSLYTDNHIHCIEGCNQGEDFQVVPRLLYYANRTVNLSEPLYYYDCSNEGAYSNSFTKEKHNQNWKSMDVVKLFFKYKGVDYNNAVEGGRVRQVADDLIISAKTSGDIAKCYYDFACRELKRIGRDHWKNVALAKRIILFLSSNYSLMKMYALSMRWLRHTTLHLKTKLLK